jgi:epoxyqueuosine reductase
MSRLSQFWPSIQRVADANGVARLGASNLTDVHADLYDAWLDRGHHATMHYLAKNRATRRDPASRFPWANSVVVILVPYTPTRPDAPDGALTNHIARYAFGDDYHDVLDRILREIEGVFAGAGVKTWRYVDTGPLSDRAYGAQSGLGWIGRNGMLINQELGSYFFIGTLLTSLENDVAAHAVADRCGTCTRCLDACPTNAILPDRTLDSNLCISYATIEHRGALPAALPLAGNAFGCDICQEACPWNHDPAPAHPSFAPRDEYRATPISDLLRYEQADFSTLFRKSAIKRAKLAGMQRNVAALFDSASGTEGE